MLHEAVTLVSQARLSQGRRESGLILMVQLVGGVTQVELQLLQFRHSVSYCNIRLLCSSHIVSYAIAHFLAANRCKTGTRAQHCLTCLLLEGELSFLSLAAQ